MTHERAKEIVGVLQGYRIQEGREKLSALFFSFMALSAVRMLQTTGMYDVYELPQHAHELAKNSEKVLPPELVPLVTQEELEEFFDSSHSDFYHDEIFGYDPDEDDEAL